MKKRLLTLLLAILFIFTLTLPSFAESVTLRTLLQPADSSQSTLDISRVTSSGTKYKCSYRWRNDNDIYINGYGSETNFSGIAIDADSYNVSLATGVNDDECIVVSGTFYLYCNTPFTSSQISSFALSFDYLLNKHVADSYISEYVPAKVTVTKSEILSWGALKFTFNAFLDMPNDYYEFQGMSIFINHPTIPINEGIGLMGENFDFYVGSVENAPIYPTYDNSAGNTADSKGQSIIDNSQSGLDDVRFYNSALADILAEGGSLTAGLFFLNGFLTDIIGNVAWLNSVLVISLALGVLMLILGITNIVGKSLGSSNSVKKEGSKK